MTVSTVSGPECERYDGATPDPRQGRSSGSIHQAAKKHFGLKLVGVPPEEDLAAAAVAVIRHYPGGGGSGSGRSPGDSGGGDPSHSTPPDQVSDESNRDLRSEKTMPKFVTEMAPGIT
jgi:hypothetical protein